MADVIEILRLAVELLILDLLASLVECLFALGVKSLAS